MEKAGMVDRTWGKLIFINETEFHTVFAPSDEALSRIDSDSLSLEELQLFIKYHFLEGDIIFTDGNKSAGDYETLRVDESSTPYIPRFSALNIRPDPDLIRIYDQSGDLVCDIPEHSERTNIMFGRRDPGYKTTGVVHAIDSVLLYP